MNWIITNTRIHPINKEVSIIPIPIISRYPLKISI